LSRIVYPPYYGYCNKYITNRNRSQQRSKGFKKYETKTGTATLNVTVPFSFGIVGCPPMYIIVLLYRT